MKLFATLLSSASWHRLKLGYICILCTSGPAREALICQAKGSSALVSCLHSHKWMPGERVQEPVSSWFPHVQWVSFPSSWSVCHFWGCSFLQWLTKSKYAQASTSVSCHPLQRGLLCSSVTVALQSTTDLTFGNETFWCFSNSGYFGNFFFFTVRIYKHNCFRDFALLCFETDVLHFCRAFTYMLFSHSPNFLKIHSKWAIHALEFKKKNPTKKGTKAGQKKAFSQCLTTWVTQM